MRLPIPRPILLVVLLPVFLLLPGCSQQSVELESPPNVIIIITDDQGHGDFGFYGNPVLQTPHLDEMARNSARLENYYVSPVCAPTRASLMTGRYNYRTGVVDTYLGRAMMATEEITLAERLRDQGYKTGIFGKWHLGDSYPMRPMDQGFEESLVHRGGGIGQPSDPTGAEGKYTDPTLLHNGELKEMEGYCTDIYFSEALQWIEDTYQEAPFFAYIPTNAPHGPYHDVPDSLYQYYKSLNLNHGLFPEDPNHPFTNEMNADRVARIFAMITNVDENVGRLFTKLEELEITDNTLVLFMLDNGPNTRRFVNGMRGMKTSVYEGGVHSPLFAHWPGTLPPGVASDRISAHIDITPTILDAAGVDTESIADFDGISLLPLLTRTASDWPERNIFIQTHRGDVPVRYHHFFARSQNWKVVHQSGFGPENFEGEPQFELYNMETDPLETNNVADQFPDTLQALIAAYDAWFDDVSATRENNYDPPRIVVDPAHESTTVLTRQDWRYPGTHGRGGWARDALGYWLIQVDQPGTYTVDWRFYSEDTAGTATLKVNGTPYSADLAPGDSTYTFEAIEMPAGPITIEAELSHGGKTKGIHQMDIAAL